MKTIKYLGINFGHDAALSIINNEKIFTILTERINGVKQSAEINAQYFNKCLRLSESALNEINSVGITSTQGKGIAFLKNRFFEPISIDIDVNEINDMISFGNIENLQSKKWHFISKNQNWMFMPYPSRKSLLLINQNKKNICDIRNHSINLNKLISKVKSNGIFKNVFFVDHHLAHSFSGMAKLPDYSNSVVISIDGANHTFEPNYPITFSGLVIRLTDNNISTINPALFYGGAFYSLMANSIGLSEGKLMGLSAYAKSLLTTKKIQKFINIIESVDLRKKYLDLSKELSNPNLVEFINKKLSDLNRRNLPDNSKIALAANTQKIFEYYYVNFIQDIINKFQPKNLVIVGGCALNCPSNSILKKNNPFLNLIIDNSCNDEGLSNGCAQTLRFLSESILPVKNESPYLGEYIINLDALLSSSLSDNQNYFIYKNKTFDIYAQEIVSQLRKNKIGIFMRGRYEIGPRALLNRSIIGRSDIADNHFIINKIKSREPWRPLAPVTNQEYFDTFFDGPQNSYMLMTQTVKNPLTVPAIAHVDSSARCQVISNDNITNLILRILASDGIPPVLINTSFNSKDEPIINDAIRAFDLFNQFDEFGFLLFDDVLIVKKMSNS